MIKIIITYQNIMTKLIILTSAITRGEFHRTTIGKFYEKFTQYLTNLEVYHIINIDQPEQLKNKFSQSETQKILNEIIPELINKTFILTKTPSFLGAFKNVVNKVDELNLLSEENLYWWFEDDWDCTQYYNIFEFVKLFCSFKNTAINFTSSSPLGSFRAGPFMSGSYFINYFNIERMGIMNDTCDPEKQVGRWLSGIDRINGNQKIYRNFKLTNNDTIQIVFLCVNDVKLSLSEIPRAYYQNKAKFNETIKFKYYIVTHKVDNCENAGKYRYCEIENINNVTDKNILLSSNDASSEDLKNIFDNGYITYVCIKPYVFVDSGRTFNLEHTLKKWEKIGDATTYV
jgi:hypothetical protein